MGAIKITKVTDYIGDYYILSGEGKSWYGIWCLSVQAACSAVVCDLHGYQAYTAKRSFLLFQDGVSSPVLFLLQSNRQIWPWSTKRSRTKANRVLPREHPGHSKYPLPTTQHSTHGHHQMVNTKIRLIMFLATKDGEAPYSQQKQDKELTVAQIMNSLLPNSD